MTNRILRPRHFYGAGPWTDRCLRELTAALKWSGSECGRSGENAFDHIPCSVGVYSVAAAETIGELLMMPATEVEVSWRGDVAPAL